MRTAAKKKAAKKGITIPSPVWMQRLDRFDVELTIIGNRITQLNADMHREVGSIKNAELKRKQFDGETLAARIAGLEAQFTTHETHIRNLIDRMARMEADKTTAPVSRKIIHMGTAWDFIAENGFRVWLESVGLEVGA